VHKVRRMADRSQSELRVKTWDAGRFAGDVWFRLNTPNEALPQTDEVYAEDGALIAIANDRWTPIEPAGTMP
jgi:hypothetical protein